ncbi:MAG: hypothetical protein R3E66_13105 [bacterium]
MPHSRLRTPTAIAAILLVSMNLGCSSQCPQVKSDYEQRLSTEATFVQRAEATPPTHFGVTLKSSVLNRMVELALNDGLGRALDLADTVSLASGQSISVKTDGAPADLAVYADAACDHCLRVAGKLSGDLAVKVPILPIQRVPLKGTFSLVAPIEFARNDAGKSEVRLNLEKMAEIGKSSMDAEIAQLAPTWANVLKAPLSQKLLTAVTSKLGSVTLLQFSGASLGIEGLEVFPTQLKTDAKNGLVYLGFGSNLAAEGTLQPILDLTADQNAAIAISPAILVPAVQAGLKATKVPRRYDSDGKQNPTGDYHVTIGSFASTGDNASELWLSAPRTCPRTASVIGSTPADAKMAIVDNKFVVDIAKVELKDSSLPGVVLAVANWASSGFVGEGKRVLQKSLSDQVITVPGSTSTLAATAFSANANAFVLKGKLNVTPTAP